MRPGCSATAATGAWWEAPTRCPPAAAWPTCCGWRTTAPTRAPSGRESGRLCASFICFFLHIYIFVLRRRRFSACLLFKKKKKKNEANYPKQEAYVVGFQLLWLLFFPPKKEVYLLKQENKQEANKRGMYALVVVVPSNKDLWQLFLGVRCCFVFPKKDLYFLFQGKTLMLKVVGLSKARGHESSCCCFLLRKAGFSCCRCVILRKTFFL